MKLKKIIRGIVPERLYVFASGCKQPYSFLLSHLNMIKTYKKREKNNKIRLIFIVQRTEVFTSVKTICEAAYDNPNFEVIFLPIPRWSIDTLQLNMESYESVYRFCRDLNLGTVVDSYDNVTKEFVDISSLNPDYIFLNTAYTETYPDKYSIDKLKLYGKVCYVPYGFVASNEEKYNELYSYEYGYELLRDSYFLFADGDVTYNYLKRKLSLSEIVLGKRVFNVGFPRFDLIDTEHKTQGNSILWLPRWTTEKESNDSNLKSSFFEFNAPLLKYTIDNSRSVKLTIRPHPSMFDNFVRDGFMTREEISNYCKTIEQEDNIALDQSPNYLPALYESSILLADYTSLIFEFFLLNKPIIFCGKMDDLSKQINYIAESFYYVNNWNEVECVITELLSGVDKKRDIREKAVSRFINTSCNAGRKIVEILYKDFINN